jgi:hypothetical protein
MGIRRFPAEDAWIAWNTRSTVVDGSQDTVIHQDGIRFQGLRFVDPTLAAYVGESAILRHDRVMWRKFASFTTVD